MRRAAVTHVLAILLAVLTLATGLVAITGPSASAAPPDGQVGPRDCALAGRVYVHGAGCSRTRCVAGARMDKKGRDAELCERAGRGGAPYGQPINPSRCRALGRVWIGEINICASNPRRLSRVTPHAPMCANPRATYVNHREEEGYYDECLAPDRLREVERIARKQKTSLAKAALDRGRANCSYRAGWVLQNGVCVARTGSPPASPDGLFMIGDSVSWRAWDELRQRVPGSWELDLRPGRRLDELAGRLDWYRANHGDPSRIVIQLGTNRRNGYSEDDFRATMATITPGTPVLLVLPYRKFTGANAHLVAATERSAAWMTSLAADRPRTCLADWPTFAAKNLDKLVDGEHPSRSNEGWYARYVVRAWDDCAAQLGV